jgi:hypothetical protein
VSDWGNFFFAQVGASAALAGLLFVGVSINLARISQFPTLPDHALQALAVLVQVQVLIVSSLALVPRQATVAFGIEILAAGTIAWAMAAVLATRSYRAADRQYRAGELTVIVLGQAATLPVLVAGVVVLVSGFGGLYWLVPRIVFSYLVAVVDAWVLLIEIYR